MTTYDPATGKLEPSTLGVSQRPGWSPTAVAPDDTCARCGERRSVHVPGGCGSHRFTEASSTLDERCTCGTGHLALRLGQHFPTCPALTPDAGAVVEQLRGDLETMRRYLAGPCSPDCPVADAYNGHRHWTPWYERNRGLVVMLNDVLAGQYPRQTWERLAATVDPWEDEDAPHADELAPEHPACLPGLRLVR